MRRSCSRLELISDAVRNRRLLAGLAMFCLVSLGGAPDAASLTLKQFDRLNATQKENFISTVLHFHYFNYLNDPATARKADCMADLGKKETQNGDSYLLSLIAQTVARDVNMAARGQPVERIIKDLVDRRCETY